MKDGNPEQVDAADRNSLARVLVHDLRNAVAPIRNAAQLLRLRGGADADLASVTDIIDRQVNEIVRILDALGNDDRPGSGDLGSAANRDVHLTPLSATGLIARNILVVDDNAALLASLSAILREAGHEVKTAADGAEALALAQSWKPDFVLLDAQMPRMNGFEVARQLRASFPPAVMKLVLMSGSPSDETTLRGAERAGFDHYIDKIHDFAALEKLLRNDA
jgi:CheY-like chemotaxis protein